MRIKKEKMPFHSIATKEKYNIKDNDVVVIEKNTALLSIIVVIIKILMYTVLLSLAFIGLISIIIPETREILLLQAESVFGEFTEMTGGG